MLISLPYVNEPQVDILHYDTASVMSNLQLPSQPQKTLDDPDRHIPSACVEVNHIKVYLWSNISLIRVINIAFSAFNTANWASEKQPACKKNWVILCWYGYLSEVQMIHIWPADSWCHCHPIISWFTKIQNGLLVPFWCKLTQEVFVLITNFKALCPSYEIPQWPPALQDDADVSQLGELAPNDSVVVVDVGRLPPPNS